MKKFKNKITGDVVRERSNLDSRFYTNEIHSIPAIFVENSNDWEELEEMPEYVECINEVYSEITHRKGDIRKTLYDSNSKYPYRFYTSFSENSTDGYQTLDDFLKHFKPSTKAAYEAQQQELADKALLEKLIKESGFKIGDIVYCNYKNIHATDKQQFSGSTVSNRTIKDFKLINGNLVFRLEGDTTLYFWCKDVVKLPQSKTLTLGSSNIEIKISKGKIEAAGRNVDINRLTELISIMKGKGTISAWSIQYPITKIGCSTFTLAELEQIVETYNELNK